MGWQDDPVVSQGTDTYSRNQAYAKPAPAGGYLTQLPPQQEAQFQAWVKQNNVPFDPTPKADYDMRGFYKGLMSGDPHAQTGVNQNDGKLHFSDYWKTPYHKSFSNESQWATANAPRWNPQDQLVTPDGKVVFDERAASGAASGWQNDPIVDQPQPAQAPQPQRTWGQDLGRQAGLAGRAVINAVAGIPMMAMDAGVGARNLITGSDYEAPSSMFSKALTSVGLPEPQTRLEKVANFVETVLAGSKLPAPQAANQAPANFVKTDPTAMVKAQTLNEAQKAGYVVPPSTSNPTALNRGLEGASGKIATAQAAAVRNQTVTNKLARQAVGLANDAPITPETLKALRSTAGEVYGQVASSGKIVADGQYLDDLTQLGKGIDEIAKDFPEANVGARQQIDKLVNSMLRDSFDASSALKYLRQLRADAAGNLASAARNPDPEKQALGMAQREAAATLEELIGRHLAQQGQPELAQSFEQARRLIAVSHTVENALNEATGNVSAAKLAQQLKGKPYGGELQVAAKFAQAFPKAAKEVNESMPGISPLDYYASVGGSALLGSPHLLALPAIRMAIREALLSPYGQKMAVKGAEAAGTAPQNLGLAGGAALATSAELRQ